MHAPLFSAFLGVIANTAGASRLSGTPHNPGTGTFQRGVSIDPKAHDVRGAVDERYWKPVCAVFKPDCLETLLSVVAK